MFNMFHTLRHMMGAFNHKQARQGLCHPGAYCLVGYTYQIDWYYQSSVVRTSERKLQGVTQPILGHQGKLLG